MQQLGVEPKELNISSRKNKAEAGILRDTPEKHHN